MSVSEEMPPIGLGTWPLTGEDAVGAVLAGLEAGYRHLDTAAMYANEDAVGSALRLSGLPREQVFVTTKLHGRDHLDGTIRAGVERSLELLGLDRVDLFLIHWPMPQHDKYVAAYLGLLECREAGLIRHVGVSNFRGQHLRRVSAEAGEAPAANQIQLDPTLARQPVRTVHDELGVLTCSWSPLGRGDVLENPTVTEIATAQGCTPAQVVLAWHRAQGVVSVVRSANPARQAENLAALSVRLGPEELTSLSTLDLGEDAARSSDEEHL